MTSLYAVIGVVVLAVGIVFLLLYLEHQGSTAKDDLAEARRAEGLRRKAEEAEAEARNRDEELR